MTTVCRAKVVQKLKKMLKFSEKSNIQTYGKQRKKPNIHKGHRAFLAGAEGLEPSARGFGAHYIGYQNSMTNNILCNDCIKNDDQMTTADSNKACFSCKNGSKQQRRDHCTAKLLQASELRIRVLSIIIILLSVLVEVKIKLPNKLFSACK